MKSHCLFLACLIAACAPVKQEPPSSISDKPNGTIGKDTIKTASEAVIDGTRVVEYYDELANDDNLEYFHSSPYNEDPDTTDNIDRPAKSRIVDFPYPTEN